MAVNLSVLSLGNMFIDDRDRCPGDSYSWGPVINASKVKYFAFHHSVTAQTAKNDGNWKAEVDKICNLHLARGFQGVGYRFIIASSGHVLYVGDLSHGGSAVAGNNDIIFSACLVGDFTKELPTAAQIHSAYLLQKFFREDLPQYPLISSEDSIIGHQDAYSVLHLPGAEATACPGNNWRANGGLRWRYLNDKYQGYPNPQPSGVTPPPPVVPPTPPPPPIDPCVAQNVKILDLTAQIKVLNERLDATADTVSILLDKIVKAKEALL